MYKLYINKSYKSHIYVYKQDLALNNLQRLICYKNPTNQPTNQPTKSTNQTTKQNRTKNKEKFFLMIKSIP